MSTDLTKRDPVATIANLVASDAGRAQIEPVLPAGVSFDRFVRIFRTAVMDDCARQANPDKWIVNADPASLLTALVKVASDGLVPDGRQAALVRRGDKVSYMPMVAGLRHIVGQYGWTIRAYAIFSEDAFTYAVGDRPHHQPPRLGEPRGTVICSWAEATHRDGRKEYLVITPEEMKKRREMATTDTIWAKWTAQQAEKTAARDIAGELGLDESERDRIVRVLDATQLTSAETVEALYGPQDPIDSGVAHSPEGQPPEEKEDAGHSADDSSAADANDEPGLSETVDLSAADEAAAYVPPNGKFAERGQHGPKTLGEILELGDDGAGWFRWALAQSNLGGTDHPEYREAVWVFAEAYAPALHAEAAAKRDLS